MNKSLLKFLPVAAALLIAASCSKDDDGNAPASGRDGVHTVSTTTDTTKNVSIPFAITVGGRPSSLTKAQVVESESGGLTQKFSEGDVLIITGDGLDKGNPSVLTITPEGIDQETATFTGNLNLATGVALTSGVSRLTATLANKTLGNQGQPLAAPVLVSDLEEAFEKYGYLVADFTYDAGATSINLEQHTAFLVFNLPYNGAKVNVKIGDVTTPVFVQQKQVLAVPDGATVSSQLMKDALVIDLQPKTPGAQVDVVFDIKRDDLPENCVPGLFSVSADKQVFFSKGNLMYQASTGTWKFADNQSDYIGNAAGNTTANEYDGEGNITKDNRANNSAYIDLFGWGMWLDGQDPTKTVDDYTYYLPNVRSGNFTGASAIGSEWETLTCGDDDNPGEWNYLLGLNGCIARANAANLNHLATVNDVPGLVILPDGYDYTSINWSNYDWADLEKAGAVFLPASGRRLGTVVVDIGNYGYYWSSSSFDECRAFNLFFVDGNVDWGGYYRYNGQSVRLVRAL